MRRVFNEITGKSFEVPPEPRIVSLAPSITDILDQIGAWRWVVGVSIYCNIPPKAREKPRVGAYLKVMDRRLAELEPDIIFTTTGAQRETTLKLVEEGYNVYPVPLPISLYGILENMFTIANVLGLTENAIERGKELVETLSNIRDKVEGSVYYEIDLGGPITAGKISYIHTALRHIGLDNIYGDVEEPWIQPDPNFVKERDPEIILYEVKPGDQPDKEKVRKMFIERGLSDVSAVKNDRIYVLPADSLAHYGPTLYETLRRVVAMIREG